MRLCILPSPPPIRLCIPRSPRAPELVNHAESLANAFECVGNVAAEVDFELIATLADAIEVRPRDVLIGWVMQIAPCDCVIV